MRKMIAVAVLSLGLCAFAQAAPKPQPTVQELQLHIAEQQLEIARLNLKIAQLTVTADQLRGAVQADAENATAPFVQALQRAQADVDAARKANEAKAK